MNAEEQNQFSNLIRWAIENRRDSAPENASEFDIYADMEYNLYMYIKGEWNTIGLNISPLS